MKKYQIIVKNIQFITKIIFLVMPMVSLFGIKNLMVEEQQQKTAHNNWQLSAQYPIFDFAQSNLDYVENIENNTPNHLNFNKITELIEFIDPSHASEKKLGKFGLTSRDVEAQNDIAKILVAFVDEHNKQHVSAYLDEIKAIIKANPNVQFVDDRFIPLIKILNENKNRVDFTSSFLISAKNSSYWIAKMSDPIVNKSARIMINILNSNPETKILAPDNKKLMVKNKEWKVKDIDFLHIIKIKGNPAFLS